MLRYYDERAPEYEDAYVLGTGTSSIQDPEVFRSEAALLSGIIEQFAGGHLVDLACGTAYWSPYYAARCSSITLIDQSEGMLVEARRKLATLQITDRCSVVRADLFDYDSSQHACDCALIGFFLSHLDDEQERLLFRALERMLGTTGRFLILDSAWSPERARFNAKAERQVRRLNDGTRFEIYKRYVSLDDIAGWASRYNVALSVEHFGAAFVAVSGRFMEARGASGG